MERCWFSNYLVWKHKNKYKCIYAIEEFYPSISKNLLKKTRNYPRAFVDISSAEEETTMHCWKSLLFNNSDEWINK